MTTPDSAYLTAAFDLDGIARGTAPRRSVVVCATPGIDVDTLTEALHRCGAGVPMAYFDGETTTATLARRWRVITVEEYVAALHHRRTTADGVFGLVLQWKHLRHLHQQVSGPTQMSAARTTALVGTVAPNAQFVVTSHGDEEIHAVRAALAAAGAAASPREVAAQRTRIAAAERAWRQWLDTADTVPVALAVDGSPTLDHVARELDLPTPDGDTTVTGPESSPAERDLLRRFRDDVASGALDNETLPPPSPVAMFPHTDGDSSYPNRPLM